MLLSTLLLAATVSAQETNVIEQRFSQDTLRALNTAADTAIFPLSGRSPDPIYDKAAKLLDLKPVLAWLQKQQLTNKAMAATEMDHLRSLILNPKNHRPGLFSVIEPRLTAVSFTSNGQKGFIVLGNSLVSIFWEGRLESALLNDIGADKLQEWLKANG